MYLDAEVHLASNRDAGAVEACLSCVGRERKRAVRRRGVSECDGVRVCACDGVSVCLYVCAFVCAW